MTVRATIIIPSRLAAMRLPRKPLQLLCGTPLIERAWRCARSSQLASRVVVATDSEEIASVMRDIGAEVVLTEAELPTGSDRVAACARILGIGDDELVINFQGDMPLMEGSVVDRLIESAATENLAEDVSIFTVAAPIFTAEEYNSPHTVKIAISDTGQALYFSRAQIPHSVANLATDSEFSARSQSNPNVKLLTDWPYWKHFGVYLFRPKALQIYGAKQKRSALEISEGLEQLRLLERGGKIFVVPVTPAEASLMAEVNTLEDVATVERLITDLRR